MIGNTVIKSIAEHHKIPAWQMPESGDCLVVEIVRQNLSLAKMHSE